MCVCMYVFLRSFVCVCVSGCVCGCCVFYFYVSEQWKDVHVTKVLWNLQFTVLKEDILNPETLFMVTSHLTKTKPLTKKCKKRWKNMKSMEAALRLKIHLRITICYLQLFIYHNGNKEEHRKTVVCNFLSKDLLVFQSIILYIFRFCSKLL